MNLNKKLLFTKKLLFLYKSGKPLKESLEYLSRNEKSAYFRTIFNDFAQEINAGGSLYSAINKKEELFGEVYCKLIKVGESSGRLEEVLGKIIELIENSIRIRKKIVAASIYPVILIFVFMFIFVVVFNLIIFLMMNFFNTVGTCAPSFLLLLNSFQRLIFSLPGCMFIIISLILILVFVCIFLNIEQFDKFRSFIFNLIPGFGHLEKFKQLYTYIFAFKICYESGLTTLESASLATEIVNNDYLFDKFIAVYDHIVKGDTLASSLNGIHLLDHELIELIRTGEESGRLEESLNEVLKQIDEKIMKVVSVMLLLMKPLGVIMGIVFVVIFLFFMGFIIVSLISNAFSKI